MLAEVVKNKQNLVTIIDPHLKNDEEFFVYKEAKRSKVLVMSKDMEIYHGKCWPSTSAWLDYFNPEIGNLLEILYCKSHSEKLKQITTD